MPASVKSFARFFGVLVLLFAQSGSVSASDVAAANCVSKGWGFRSAAVEDKGIRKTYVLRMNGLKWRLSPYGYHAPANLSCASCDPAMGGLVYMYGDEFRAPATSYIGSVDPKIAPYPRTVSDRIALDSELFGYPIRVVSGENLSAIYSHENLKVGAFEGYAVLYDAKIPARDKRPEQNFGLLALSLSDGCALLDTALQSDKPFASNHQEIVDDILTRMTIETYADGEKIPITFTERIGQMLNAIDYKVYEWRKSRQK